MRRLALALASVASLAGCEAPPRSESYFRDHQPARDRVLAACRDGRQRGGECQSAQTARRQVEMSTASAARLNTYREGFR